jgi:solute carrier organic anion transporter family, member 5A
MFNNFAGIFYTFGYMPFFTFQAKYIEIQYKVSASKASFITGSVSMGFTALGLLVSGAVISKCKPSARTLAAWNIITSILSMSGIIAYSYFGCNASDNNIIVQK